MLHDYDQRKTEKNIRVLKYKATTTLGYELVIPVKVSLKIPIQKGTKE